jgi:hypothetical protein
MPNTATVTGKTGPALTVTAVILTGVTDMNFDLHAYVLKIDCDQGHPEFDLYNTTTVTYTIASKIATVTISQ